MRPPEEMKDYFKPMEEYALKQLDKPGGLNTIPRWKRFLIVVPMLIAAGVFGAFLLMSDDEPIDGVTIAIIGAIALPFVGWFLLLAWEPRRFFRAYFWGSPKPDELPAMGEKAEDA